MSTARRPADSGRASNNRSSIYRGGDGRWHGRITMGVKNDGSPDRRHVTGKTEKAVTEKVRLGTNVYNIGLRHPFVTARAIATLDVISRGRVEFGIGASWLEEEWEVTGLDFHTRGRRVDETIDICRRLWAEDVVEHHGEFFDFAPVMFNPKPVQQPQPQLLIGGDGAAAKRRAAQVGDAWLPMNHSLEQLPAALAEINEQRAAAGRDGTTTLTVSGSIESLADVDRYRDAGVDRVCVRPFTSSREALEGIRRFGDDILTKLA